MKKYIVTILIFLVIVVVNGFLFNSLFQSEQEKYEDSVKNDIQQQTIMLSNALWYLFNDYISDISLMSSFLGHIKKTPNVDFLKFLYENAKKPEIGLLNIAFFDNDGIQQCIYPSKYSNSNKLNYSFRHYFKEAQKTNKTIISKALTNYRPQKVEQEYRSIVFITPIINLNKKKYGYILLNFDILSFKKLMRHKNKKDDRYISFYLVDTKNDELLYAPQSLCARKLSSSDRDFCSFVINFSKTHNGKNSKLTKVSGKKLYISSSQVKIASTSLAVAATIPYKDTISYTADFSRRISLITVYIGLVLFMIATFVMYNEFIVKKLANKISRLEIIIDEKTKEQEMKNIVQSEYFKELKSKIKSIK
jgi:hypothetical protein